MSKNDQNFDRKQSAPDAIFDPARRNALLGDAQRILAEESVNGFLFELAQNGVWKKGIKGLWANRPIQANDVTAVYWE